VAEGFRGGVPRLRLGAPPSSSDSLSAHNLQLELKEIKAQNSWYLKSRQECQCTQRMRSALHPPSPCLSHSCRSQSRCPELPTHLAPRPPISSSEAEQDWRRVDRHILKCKTYLKCICMHIAPSHSSLALPSPSLNAVRVDGCLA
jgi:hypothetical protein